MKKLLLLGDSLIEFYNWQEEFPSYQVTNGGVAGESVQGLLRRVRLNMVGSPAADWILVMIGTNNLAMEDYGFINDYRELVLLLRTRFPRAAIILNSLLPLQLPWLAESAVSEINRQIRKLTAAADNLFYLDLHTAFLESGGTGPSPLFDDDGVHLSRLGYALWSEVLAKKLNEINSI